MRGDGGLPRRWGKNPDAKSRSARCDLIRSTPIDRWRPSPTAAPTTYPGKIPAGDYLLVGGRVEHRSFESTADRLEELGAVPLADRSAVLAVGSNAAPARLFDKCGDDSVVPVVRVEVAGWVAVYSAHITKYGSIAATLWPDADSATSLSVAFFDPEQLRMVDGTEPNYRRIDLGPLVDGWHGGVSGYCSRRGALSFDGWPVRLAELQARSALSAMTQLEALEAVADQSGLASGGPTLAAGVASGAIEPGRIAAWMADGRAVSLPDE